MAGKDLLDQLPPADTDEGLMVRILLAETVGPASPAFNPQECFEAMQLMQRVVHNRMKAPRLFGNAKSASMRDIVRAREPVQFEGFEDYPSIKQKQLGIIRDKLAHRSVWEVNEAWHTKRMAKNEALMASLVPSGPKRDPFKPPPKLFLDLDRENRQFLGNLKLARQEIDEGTLYVNKALEVARKPPIPDPSPGTLVYWRTKGSGSPNEKNAILFTTKSGNSFYYIEKLL